MKAPLPIRWREIPPKHIFVSRLAPMNRLLWYVVPASAGAIAIRESCFGASQCCRLKAGLHALRLTERVRERGFHA